MNRLTRRGFLGLIPVAAAGMVLDPDRLLWRPGAKTIFIPAPMLPVSLSLTTADIIACFKEVYSAERLAELSQLEVTLLRRLRAR